MPMLQRAGDPYAAACGSVGHHSVATPNTFGKATAAELCWTTTPGTLPFSQGASWSEALATKPSLVARPPGLQ